MARGARSSKIAPGYPAGGVQSSKVAQGTDGDGAQSPKAKRKSVSFQLAPLPCLPGRTSSPPPVLPPKPLPLRLAAVGPPPYAQAPSAPTPRAPAAPAPEVSASAAGVEVAGYGETASVFVGTWNMHGKDPPEDLSPWLGSEIHKHDFYVIGTQEACRSIEMSLFLPSKAKWEAKLREALGPEYVCLATNTLAAIHLAVFARRKLLDSIRYVRTAQVHGSPVLVPQYYFLNKLVHKSTSTGLGSTTSAPRGGGIEDTEREVWAGRSQGSRPSGVY